MKLNILIITIFLFLISLKTLNGQCDFNGSLNLSPNDSICSGNNYNLFATGAASYTWSPDSLLDNADIPFPTTINLTETVTFTLTVFDNNGCSTNGSVEIFVHNSPNANAGNDTTICTGTSFQIEATGGEEYIWNPDNGLSNLLISNPVATPTNTSTYVVEVIDSNDCKINDSIKIVLFDPTNASAGFDQNICKNDAHLLQASGGVSFHWEPAEYINHPDSSSALCFPPDDMEFIVEVEDSNGCTAFDSVRISVFKISISNDTIICSGDSTKISVLGDPSTEFLWSPFENISDSSISEPWVFPTDETSYSVIATNALGCIDYDTLNIEISKVESIIDTNLVAGCDGFYIDFINLSSTDLNHYWLFSDNLQSNEDTVEKSFDFNSSIESRLFVENDKGCKDSSVISITSLSFETIFNFESFNPPNIFTPNGDGINDLYELNFPGRINECVNLVIYNKWGEVQFSSTGNNIYWDGFTNTGIPASQGIYYYYLNLKNNSKSGFLQLFR